MAKTSIYLNEAREEAIRATGMTAGELIDYACAALGHPVPASPKSPRGRYIYRCCEHCKHPPRLTAHDTPCRTCRPEEATPDARPRTPRAGR